MPLNPDERLLVETARAKAERLVQSLQTDADSLPPGSEGHRLHLIAIDAARLTLNNLNRLLDERGGIASAAEADPHG